VVIYILYVYLGFSGVLMVFGNYAVKVKQWGRKSTNYSSLSVPSAAYIMHVPSIYFCKRWPIKANERRDNPHKLVPHSLVT